MNKQSGQTLIEVIAAVSIASVVLGGLVVVVLNGLRNAKFAQNQALATKYGQDSLEELRAIRDRNSVVLGNGNPLSCYLTGSCDTLVPPATPSCLTPGPGGVACYFTLDDSSLALTDVSLGSVTSQLGNGFTRSIEMTTPVCPTPPGTCTVPTNEKTFTVTISWVDISGTHQSNLQTNLTQL